LSHPDAGHCLDVDLSCGTEAAGAEARREGAHSSIVGASSPPKQQESAEHNESNESYADEQELEKLKHLTNREHRSEDDNEVIHRLVQSLHQRNTDFRALELQYNHIKLQNESLLYQERKLRETVNTLEFEMAISEENVSLLEEQLKNVVSFEDGYATSAGGGEGAGGGGGGQSSDGSAASLQKLRGTLLHASHRQIYDLEQELRQLRRLSGQDAQQHAEAMLRVQSQNQALREEARGLGERLAQRTVLFSAQERRFQSQQRASCLDLEDKADELRRTAAQRQQLEGQCAQLDRERIELLLRTREQQEALSALRGAEERAAGRALELEQELAGALEANRALQEALSLLRGADLEELERGMVRGEERRGQEGEMCWWRGAGLLHAVSRQQ
jgi:hypothetical protein